MWVQGCEADITGVQCNYMNKTPQNFTLLIILFSEMCEILIHIKYTVVCIALVLSLTIHYMASNSTLQSVACDITDAVFI